MTEKRSERDALFERRECRLRDDLKVREKQSDQFTLARTISFLCGAGFFVLYFIQRAFVWALPVGCVSLLGFIVAVVLHNRVKAAVARLSLLVRIHDEHKARLLHDFSLLEDDGADFADNTHEYAGDLDLFGKESLFHFLNVGRTWHGRNRLASLFRDGNVVEAVSAEEILKRQEAVQELAGNPESMEEFQCLARLSRQDGKDPQELIAYAKGDSGGKGMQFWHLALSGLVTVSFLVSVILAFVFAVIPPLVSFVLFGVQVLVTAATYGRYRETFASVDGFHKELSSYTGLFEAVEKAEVSSALLGEIRSRFLSEGHKRGSASYRNRRLKLLAAFIHLRSQPLFYLVLNVLFLYDRYCIYFLEKWQRECGGEMEGYLQGIGDWEALLSLSVLSLVYPEDCFPEFEDEKSPVCFRAEEMGHPLIPVDRQVRNSLVLERQIGLITGSNMSGKTTLLRTVGVNAVLAYAGACCCAKSLRLSRMCIGTSMRITDNLGEGLSTFYAELVRIGSIIKRADEEKPLLFLIDEIFRGTNSRDRTDGALLVLQKLAKPWIIGLMSTHDYALCQLEEAKVLPISDYHFSESYDAEGIHFDYHLAPGVSMSSNARYLMKLMGIE